MTTRRALEATCSCPRWRRWRVTSWLASHLYQSGITSSGGSWRLGGDGHAGCVTLPGLDRHRRPYVLWISRDTWHCWLIGRHRRGVPIIAGLCGKCLPCPGCGSVDYSHAPDCPEDCY